MSLQKQESKNLKKIVSKISQNRVELINGEKNIEDIIPEAEFLLYADEMTQEQYEAKLAACKDSESREKFTNGELQKKVSITGKYSDWSENVRRKIMNKIASDVKNDVEAEMEDYIKKNGRLYYTNPSHARYKDSVFSGTAEPTTAPASSKPNTQARSSGGYTQTRGYGGKSSGGSRRSPGGGPGRSSGSSSGTSARRFVPSAAAVLKQASTPMITPTFGTLVSKGMGGNAARRLGDAKENERIRQGGILISILYSVMIKIASRIYECI